MNIRATIDCECGSIFSYDFQTVFPFDFQTECEAPKCPKCKKQMDKTSWEALRRIMTRFADFNYHIYKWSSERNEPRMLVPSLTISCQED